MANRIPFEAFQPPATSRSQIDDIMKAVARAPMASPAPRAALRRWIPAAAALAVAAAVALLIALSGTSEGERRADGRLAPADPQPATVADDKEESRVGAARKLRNKRPRTVKPKPSKPSTPKAKDGAKPATMDNSERLRVAIDYERRGEHAIALAICRSILDDDPGNVDARVVCLHAACTGGSSYLARQHYDRLPPSRRTWALEYCSKHDIDLSKPPRPHDSGGRVIQDHALDDSDRALLAKARRSAMSGQYGAARNACEAILKRESENLDARTICLVAACALKREKSARRHYRRLPASRKGWAVQQCLGHGIDLP
ncbi:MAG: hypothetical protein KJO07_23780 [Deltaproteobacteria bacterium]|nr:hypothetical protein [Deltaproteobacteria bacterium]